MALAQLSLFSAVKATPATRATRAVRRTAAVRVVASAAPSAGRRAELARKAAPVALSVGEFRAIRGTRSAGGPPPAAADRSGVRCVTRDCGGSSQADQGHVVDGGSL